MEVYLERVASPASSNSRSVGEDRENRVARYESRALDGVSSPTGTPRLVTTTLSPESRVRMTALLSLRSSFCVSSRATQSAVIRAPQRFRRTLEGQLVAMFCIALGGITDPCQIRDPPNWSLAETATRHYHCIPNRRLWRNQQSLGRAVEQAMLLAGPRDVDRVSNVSNSHVWYLR